MICPTYYVRHPDGSYSIADPQPLTARARMSVEVAREMINDAGLDWHNGWTVGEDATNRYLNLIRAVEDFHNSGTAPKGDA